MLDTLCTYPLPADLFAQAIHPTSPLIAVGLSGGQVQTFRLPSRDASSDNSSNPPSSNGCGTIDTTWKTRRHKGSCRSLAWTLDGEALFSAGSDGIVKLANAETGVVTGKMAVLEPQSTTVDPPALIHALSQQTLLVATDSAALHLYDLRISQAKSNARPQQTHFPHEDYVSSLTPLPPVEASTSGFSKQWVTTGGTTLALTDLRKGALVRSEDQEEELLSSVLVRGLGKRGSSVGEKMVVGNTGGVLTLWEKGMWDDQDERIIVDAGRGGGESLDVLSNVPEEIGRGMVAVGLGDGRVKFVSIGSNKVMGEVRHDDVESVLALGFEVEGRMVSGGGQVVKVWQESLKDESEENTTAGKRERSESENSDNEDEQEEDSSEEEEKERKRRKKRKRNKGKDKSGGKPVLSFHGLG